MKEPICDFCKKPLLMAFSDTHNRFNVCAACNKLMKDWELVPHEGKIQRFDELPTNEALIFLKREITALWEEHNQLWEEHNVNLQQKKNRTKA